MIGREKLCSFAIIILNIMKRATYIIIAVLLGSMFVGSSCGSDNGHSSVKEPLSVEEILSDNLPNPYDAHLDSAPDEDCVKLSLKHIGPLRRAFRDSNYLHVEAAKEIGTGVIESLEDAWSLPHPLVEIKSCPQYYVDRLTHSYPYLVPQAADLLKEIGQRFNDTLQARGGGDYRIKVTSVMRTQATVSRLRRINRNASSESAHQFGTTFDISYSRFICDSITVNRSFEDLKNLLGEILYDLREEGRCYVVFERKQSCFHITARPVSDVKVDEL